MVCRNIGKIVYIVGEVYIIGFDYVRMEGGYFLCNEMIEKFIKCVYLFVSDKVLLFLSYSFNKCFDVKGKKEVWKLFVV